MATASGGWCKEGALEVRLQEGVSQGGNVKALSRHRRGLGLAREQFGATLLRADALIPADSLPGTR